jgi:hypothetical protein
MTEHESHRYRSVLINLELDWAEKRAALTERVTKEAHLIDTCGATTREKLHMTNTTMMMSISPFGHKAVGDLFRDQRDVFTSITLAHH